MNQRSFARSLRNALPLAAAVFFISTSADAAVFAVGDLVSNPTQVNGFEGITDDIYMQASYTEDGIRVEQMNPDLSMGIWTIYGSFFSGFSGQRSWYPNGGDHGYTRITQADGSDFGNLSVVTGSGWGTDPVTLHYSLLNDGVVVLSGTVLPASDAFPVSFLGGGFDTVDLFATSAASNDATANGLMIDQIKVSAVPVPAAAWLFGSGLIGLAGAARRRQAA